MANLSRLACILSIQHLFRPFYERFDPLDASAPEFCYLWTLTFASKDARDNPREAAKRWDSLSRWFRKTGKTCVRALERGDGGAWHYHCATPEWWDAKEMWEVCARYGFGRVDARQRPVEKAYYLAKYVGKKAGRKELPRGMRQWACVGFEGASVKTLVIRKKTRVIVADGYDDCLWDVLVWRTEAGTVLFSTRLRPDHSGADLIKHMELKNAQIKDLTTQLASGNAICVGEYRGSVLKTVDVEDFRTKQKIARLVVEHNVELGGMACTVSEWLPAGSQSAAVKYASTRGDIVSVNIEQKKKFRGVVSITGTIRTLSTLVA